MAHLVEQIFRQEGGRILAGLIRYLDGDFDLAEDALQDAFARAFEAWAREGMPDRPGAWLTRVAQRRAIDLLRRRRAAPIVEGELAELAEVVVDEPEEEIVNASGIEDDRLRLIFTCCHPALAPAAQAALALRTLCGLTTREIARAFLETEATTAQRIVRAKKKIREARITYEVPRAEQLPERLAAVLSVIYLVFNEAYSATEKASFVRVELSREAIRLGRLLHELLPGEPEATGLLALMLFHDARRAARVDAAGEIVPLAEQDRTLWDREKIEEGVALLDAAVAQRRSGSYQIQAAIAALHARAARAEETDWPQIAALYGGLLQRQPTPVVELNAAVALAMAGRLDEGLGWIAALERRGELAGYHLLPAAKAELLRRADRPAEAMTAYQLAISLVNNPAERAFLERRLAQLH
ncbi:MAG: sigma-70 family RNA polymerase sigma factor [Blastocatellia bacterium]|nr:sigma-70 family RNA polymerase sigma factor [Blastocatellia bacterium]